MDEFSLENRVLICGKTKAGKSRLLKYLLLTEIKKKTFSKIILFCPTERINNFYSDIIDNNFIFEEFNEDYLKDLVQKLTQLNSNKKPKEMKKVLLILDDIVCDTDIHHSKVMKSIYTRCRHIALSIITTCQFINLVPPNVRVNSDFVLCGSMNRNSLNILCDEYQSPTIDRNEFTKMYSDATKDYGFLVINNNSVKDNNNLNLIYGVISTPKQYIN